MTDDAKVPEWLERWDDDDGRLHLTLDAHHVFGEFKRDAESEATLEAWLAWRERVAAALGLVDRDAIIGLSYCYEANDLPQPMCYLDHQDRDAIAEHIRAVVGADEQRTYVKTAEEWRAAGAAASNKAIAAELRAQADSFDRAAAGCHPCEVGSSISGPLFREVADRLRARADELDGG